MRVRIGEGTLHPQIEGSRLLMVPRLKRTLWTPPLRAFLFLDMNSSRVGGAGSCSNSLSPVFPVFPESR